MRTYIQLVLLLVCSLPGTIKAQQLIFIKSPDDTFVLGAGRANLPITNHDPAIFADEEGYHLFFTSYFCQKNNTWYYSWDPANPGNCDISNTIQTLGYAFSDDKGLTWHLRETPLVVCGPQDWDRDAIETAAVMLNNDTLFLFYSASGYRNGSLFSERYQIGMAKLDLGSRSIKEALLTDGDRFTKQATPFIPFDTQLSSLQNNVQEPSIIRKGSSFEFYYIGLKLSIPDAGFDQAGQEITSVKLLRQKYDPYFNPVEDAEVCQISHNVNMTELKYYVNTYYLFFTSTEPGNFHEDEKIGYSTSTDGINWQPGTVILQKNAGHAYENWGVMAPTVMLDSDTLYLFYTAWGTEGHACFPVPSSGRFGIPLTSDRCVYGTMARAVASASQLLSTMPDKSREDYRIRIFPNPCRGFIKISSGDIILKRAELYSVEGSLIKIFDLSSGMSELCLSGSEAGVYLVKLYSTENSYCKKVIIQSEQE